MTDFKAFQTAGSALNAQSVRLNTIASNLANATVTAGTPEEAYRAKVPVFAAELNAQGVTQVQVREVAESQAEPLKRYQPNHPQADGEGYVYLPNVNSVEQMADMISASRSYQSNLEVMNTTKELMLQTLQMGRQ